MHRLSAGEVKHQLAARTMPGTDRTWLDVAQEAARAEGATMGEVLSMSRSRECTRARRRAWFELYDEGGFSYPAIGRGWGANHTSVMHGVKVFAAWVGVDLGPRPFAKGPSVASTGPEAAAAPHAPIVASAPPCAAPTACTDPLEDEDPAAAPRPTTPTKPRAYTQIEIPIDGPGSLSMLSHHDAGTETARIVAILREQAKWLPANATGVKVASILRACAMTLEKSPPAATSEEARARAVAHLREVAKKTSGKPGEALFTAANDIARGAPPLAIETKDRAALTA